MNGKDQVGPTFERPITILSFDLPKGKKSRCHQHAWGQFIYAISGVLFVNTESGSYIVPPNRAVWIPGGIEHSIETPSGAKVRSLLFHHEQTESLSPICNVLEVPTLFRELILEANRLAEDYDWLGKGGRLMQVIHDKIGDMETVPLHLPLPSDGKLRLITEKLLLNPADNRSINEWGTIVGALGRTLSRLYLKEVGMSFGNWRQLFRIQVALQILAQGESVTTVAYDVGYKSVSTFITMFRKQMGYTPGNMAKNA
ncbi:MAG: AraC family transcriptional regulator [Paracoccaceae bacterium]